MAEFRYKFQKASFFESQLQAEVNAAVPGCTGVCGDPINGFVEFIYPLALTQAEQILITTAVTNHLGIPMGALRPLHAILNDLNALSTTQKTNISGNLFSGTPAKVLLDTGINTAAIFVLHFNIATATLSAADKSLAKLYAIAMYTQDNPRYLVKPAFDPTINIRGDQ